MAGLRPRIALGCLIITSLAVAAFAFSPSAGLAAISVLSLLATILAARTIVTPVEDITDTARTITTGDYTARMRPRPAAEIGLLTDAFNAMADQVHAQMAAAAEERSRLAAALNSSVDAVMAVGPDGRVRFANLAAERLFQRPAHDIVGQPFAFTLADDQVLDAVRASRDLGEASVNVSERPGRQFMQVVTTPIRGGGDWSVLVVFHDLTEVRRTEQVRRDFVANVSHELRTPLAAIKSVIETLSDGAMDDKRVAQDFLDRADAEVDRLILLVEELLELSRIESGDLPLAREPTDVIALIEDVVERLRPQAEREGISISLGGTASLPLVQIDGARIERALSNLVHNAIKFTPAGGSISVDAEIAEEQLLIRVSDTGIGIAAEDLSRIFERFFKVDQSRASVGRGLGLAIVKHAVEAHGGSVKVESSLGRGATFTLSLPAQL